jgi:hypothetical protein
MTGHALSIRGEDREKESKEKQRANGERVKQRISLHEEQGVTIQAAG